MLIDRRRCQLFLCGKQKEGEITEDELKKAEDEIQKMTDKNIEEIDKILAVKEKEVMSV